MPVTVDQIVEVNFKMLVTEVARYGKGIQVRGVVLGPSGVEIEGFTASVPIETVIEVTPVDVAGETCDG